MRYIRNFVKIIKLYFFGPKCPNLGIWTRNLKKKSYYKIPDVPYFEILGGLGCFRNFWGLFWLSSARFGSFRVLVSMVKRIRAINLAVFDNMVVEKEANLLHSFDNNIHA